MIVTEFPLLLLASLLRLFHIMEKDQASKTPPLPGEKMQLTPYFELPISLNRDLTNRPCSSLHLKSSDLHLQPHLVPG
jgi:hypothetical protein